MTTKQLAEPRFKLARNLGFGDKESKPFLVHEDMPVMERGTINRLIKTNFSIGYITGYRVLCVFPLLQGGFTVAVLKVSGGHYYTGSNGKRMSLIHAACSDAFGTMQCLSAVLQLFDKHKPKVIAVNTECSDEAFKAIKSAFKQWENPPVIKNIDLSKPPKNKLLASRVHDTKTLMYMAFFQGLVDGRIYLNYPTFSANKEDILDGIINLQLKRTKKLWIQRNELAKPCVPIFQAIAMGLLC